MFEGQFTSDNWHRQAGSITERNAVNPRRWGMRVTVYTGGGSGDYVLTYGLASTNLQDNANWLKVADIGQTWGGGGGGGGWDRAVVATAGGVITLAMAAQQQRQFIGDAPINAAKTWAVTGSDPFMLQFFFEMASTDPQTMPADFFMDDALWNDAAKTWTPIQIGAYMAEASFNGVVWVLEINDSPII